MKTLRAACLLAVLPVLAPLRAGEPPLRPVAPVAATAERFTPAQLEQLLAPIALYPDALIALILPAATAPADLVLAARQIRAAPHDRSQIEARAWDESVKSLTSYPDVLYWLDENLAWTKQVGENFIEQPAEVMQAIQRLRARARAEGKLNDSPQALVITEAQVIRIVPAQPDVIFVPRYDHEALFYGRASSWAFPVFSFGAGVRVGSWLAADCDWNRHQVWIGNRHRRWTGHDWRRPVVPIAPVHGPQPALPVGVRPWTPPPRPSRPSSATYTQRVGPEPSNYRAGDNGPGRTLTTRPESRPQFSPAPEPSAPPAAPSSPPNRNRTGQVLTPAPASGPTEPAAPTPSRRDFSRSGSDRRVQAATGPESLAPTPAHRSLAAPEAAASAPRSFPRSQPAPASLPGPSRADSPASPSRSANPSLRAAPAPAPAPAQTPAAPPAAERNERRTETDKAL